MHSNILEIKISTQTLQWKDIKRKNVKKKTWSQSVGKDISDKHQLIFYLEKLIK